MAEDTRTEQERAVTVECRAALVEQFEAAMPAYRGDLSDAENVARMETWLAWGRRLGLEVD
jgi:hypothetical protein